jgi:hypothetical protein
MKNTTDSNLNQEAEQVQFEENDSEIAVMLKSVIKAYEEAWNRNNEKSEIRFSLTITTHKISTPEGNKDCAYLRLDRSIRDKGYKEQEIEKDGEKVIDDGWTNRLLHQEAYFFRNMQERVDPRAVWKDQLYVNCFARLIGAGLEYAELLQRLKQVDKAKEMAGISDEEKRLNDLGLVKADSMPAELNAEDKKYKEWLAAERAKEGL